MAFQEKQVRYKSVRAYIVLILHQIKIIKIIRNEQIKENEIMLSQSVIDLLKLKDIKPGDKVILNCNINKKTESIEFVVSGTYTDYSMEKRNDIDKLSYVSNEFVKKHN